MDRDDLRLESLERRIDRLERRLARLEDGEVLQAAATEVPEDPPRAAPALAGPPGPPPAPQTWRPPAPAHAPLPPFVPTPGAPAPTAIPGWSTAERRVTPEPPGTSARPAHEAPAWTSAPAPATLGRPATSLRDLEERFAGRALAWVGGLALVAAAVFFLSLAFSRGWINPPMRVLIGLVVGIAAFGGGTVMLARRNLLMGKVLSAVGLGIVSVALMAATRLYGLVIPEVGLAGALVAAVAAAVIAIRFDAREVAAFGLVAALVAPPITGASPTTLTLLFVATTLVGTTAIALFRSWRWLPPLAFVLAAPQLAGWVLGDPEPVQALIALAGFWLVNVSAAAGEEMRVRRDDLRPSSATLVLANATFLLWGGFAVLGSDLAAWRGTFVAAASLAHLLLGAWFLARQGLGHLFGNLVAGTGVSLLAIASFVQLGAPAVPLAWAAEGTALAWLAARRRHRWSGAASLALGCLVIAHLLLVEYPIVEAGIRAVPAFSPPFLHAEAGSLGAVLLAAVAAVVLVPVRWVRSALAGVGLLLATYAVTFELTGPWLVLALAGLAVAGLLIDRLVERLPVDERLQPLARRSPGGWFASLASLVAGLAAIIVVVVLEYPPHDLGRVSGFPFAGQPGLSLAILLVGLGAAGVLVGIRWVRSALAGTAILMVAWASGFELAGTGLVGLLALLLPVGIIGDRALGRLPDDRRFAWLGRLVRFEPMAGVAGVAAWAAAAMVGVARYLDPFTWGSVTPPPVPFVDERTLAAGLLATGAIAAVRWTTTAVGRTAGVVAATVAASIVVPFEVFADGVVVLWVALAVVAFAAARFDAAGAGVHRALAAALLGGAVVVAWAIVAPPYRLWVGDPAVDSRAALLPAWPISFLAVAGGLLLATRDAAAHRLRWLLEAGAGFAAVHLVSVGVVAAFEGQVGGTIAMEELGTQAQVALSVCWTGMGAGALVVGLARRHPMLRHAGFVLLGVATAKVFVIDLAAMDVAYRALVLAGLGILLLGSAFLFTHFRGPRSGSAGLTGGPRPIA